MTIKEARSIAHHVFDKRWKSGKMSRTAAYVWLAREMGLTRHQCHMTLFGVAECQLVVELCGAPTSEVIRNALANIQQQ